MPRPGTNMHIPGFGPGSAARGCSLALALGAALLLAACGGGGSSAAPPAGDPGATLSAAAQLGRKIFADTALSASGQQSCASCHVSSAAFAADGSASGV